MNYIKDFNTQININESYSASSVDTYATKYAPDNSFFIGWNESYWAWEYDNDNVFALLYLIKDTNELKIVIVNVHVKTGIGAGTRVDVVEQANVGTITKPNKVLIGELLKKHGHEKSRAAKPFSRNNWHIAGADNNELPLSDLLNSENVQRVAKLQTIINPVTTKQPTTGVVTKNNKERISKLSILHKKLYLLSDDEIESLLNKLK